MSQEVPPEPGSAEQGSRAGGGGGGGGRCPPNI